MPRTRRSSSRDFIRLVSLAVCLSILHVSVIPFRVVAGRSPRAKLVQNGTPPRSGPLEGSFPNLDEIKTRQPSLPRAPHHVPSMRRSGRNPRAPRTAGLVGPPLPSPSPTPPPRRLPAQIPVPSPTIIGANVPSQPHPEHWPDSQTLAANLIALNSVVPTFSLTAAPQAIYHFLSKNFWELGGKNSSRSMAALAVFPQPQGGSPYGGSPAAVPGLIEIEHFNNGAAGYHDTSSGSHGQDYSQPNYPPPSFRQPTDVDIYKDASFSNEYLIMMQAGDWMNYSVNVAQASSYTLEARTFYWGTVGGVFHVEVDGVNATGAIQIPGSVGLQTITVNGVSLTAGQHTLRVVCDSNGSDGSYMGDIDYLRLSLPSGTPYGGSPAAIPGTIETELYNAGPSGTAYYDTTAGTTGQDYDNPPNYPTPSFRQPTNVDIYKHVGCSNNYLLLGQAGDWTNYAVNVSTAGSYTMQAQVAWGGVVGTPGTFSRELTVWIRPGQCKSPYELVLHHGYKDGDPANGRPACDASGLGHQRRNGYSGDIDKSFYSSNHCGSVCPKLCAGGARAPASGERVDLLDRHNAGGICKRARLYAALSA